MSPPTSSERTDEELMAAIALRDSSALAMLYDRYAPLLFGLCLRILHQHVDAQGVLSEVFFEIWQRADRFDPSRVSARTYLVTVTRSRAVDCLRALATRGRKENEAGELRSQMLNSQGGAMGLIDGAVLAEEAQQVRAALEGLSNVQRETIELAYFGGQTHVEIAANLGLPLGTVKSSIRQGLLKLRAVMAPASVERLR
jgi:RNA polymerase sigma-70 factor, ECF subfamily